MEQESSHGSPNMERTNWVHRRINVSTKVRVTKYLKKATKNIFTLSELLGHYYKWSLHLETDPFLQNIHQQAVDRKNP